MYSPRISLDMMTVKRGAELFTVSAKDTATFFRLIKPRTTVVNLGGNAHTQKKSELGGRRGRGSVGQDHCEAPH